MLNKLHEEMPLLNFLFIKPKYQCFCFSWSTKESFPVITLKNINKLSLYFWENLNSIWKFVTVIIFWHFFKSSIYEITRLLMFLSDIFFHLLYTVKYLYFYIKVTFNKVRKVQVTHPVSQKFCIKMLIRSRCLINLLKLIKVRCFIT